MDIHTTDDAVTRRIHFFTDREMKLRENDLYFYNQPVEQIKGGARVIVNGREMGMYASYSYLGLIGHPRINAAAKAAIDKFGTGTHGVRLLAGTLTIHTELEETIAGFKHAEAALTYSSGYSTNLTVISTLMGRGDYHVRRGVPAFQAQRYGRIGAPSSAIAKRCGETGGGRCRLQHGR